LQANISDNEASDLSDEGETSEEETNTGFGLFLSGGDTTEEGETTDYDNYDYSTVGE
jgi:hypothetical protein